MSASVYANPYTYRPPPPRINYPELFYGFRKTTLRYILDSKILALAVLIQGVAMFVVFVTTLMPFWFELVLDPVQGTFGSEPVIRGATINTGLFYMRETDFDNTVFLDKYTNADTVPPILKGAQALSIMGTCILVGCTGAGVILLCRRFASVTALMVLASASTLAAVLHVFVILLCIGLLVESSCDPYETGADCVYARDNLEWHMVPIYTQFYRVEPTLTPYVKPGWAFYIAILGALITCGAAVMMWIEACLNSRNLQQIRYQQLKEHRDPYEKETDIGHGEKYRYVPPTQHMPNTYGMQPVITSGGPYEGMFIAPPQQERPGYVPPPTFAPQVRPPSPGFGRRGPPSVASSTSGQVITREIDL